MNVCRYSKQSYPFQMETFNEKDREIKFCMPYCTDEQLYQRYQAKLSIHKSVEGTKMMQRAQQLMQRQQNYQPVIIRRPPPPPVLQLNPPPMPQYVHQQQMDQQQQSFSQTFSQNPIPQKNQQQEGEVIPLGFYKDYGQYKYNSSYGTAFYIVFTISTYPSGDDEFLWLFRINAYSSHIPNYLTPR